MFVLPVFIPFHEFSHFCPYDPLIGRGVSEWLGGVGCLVFSLLSCSENGLFFTKVPLHSPFLLPLTFLPESHPCTFSLGHKVTSVFKSKEFELNLWLILPCWDLFSYDQDYILMSSLEKVEPAPFLLFMSLTV